MGMAPTVVEKYKNKDPNHMPLRWFNFYIVYQYRDDSMEWLSSVFIVGFDSLEAAEEFKDQLLTKKHILVADLYNEYPPHMIKDKAVKK